MTSQLVALATQSRNALGFPELDELDDELPVPHMFISACRQLALPIELDEELEVPKQVPHLAMMLSTAFSHRDGVDNVDLQPETQRIENTNPRKARFMSFPHEPVMRSVYCWLPRAVHWHPGPHW
jgi:hypothetical protein